ncbi:MAG: threonylcarbamoyl-AMP synthase [Ignavibacteria bacterium]|nr:threonylcarbamoyl-AMP synthase [Ignavibacteria bacterium]
MELYELHPITPQKRFITKAAESLRAGEIVIFPTDTYYGMGCSIYAKGALERLFSIKNETRDKLFSFIVPDLKDISTHARVSDFAYKKMRKLLPGPYTFILPAAREVPKRLWSKRKTVGIRVPDHAIAIELARELGHPIVSTSTTNRRGDILTRPEEIESVLGFAVDVMLSAGYVPNQPSSVIDLSGDEPVIIREGAGDISSFED